LKSNKIDVATLNQKIIDNIEAISNKFDFEIVKSVKFYYGKCPVHGGDNNSAFNIYHTGNSNVGNWCCYTNQCEKTFLPTPVGLIRGLLSRQKHKWSKPQDQNVSFLSTIKWCENLFGCEVDGYKIEIERNADTKLSGLINSSKIKEVEYKLNIPKEEFLANLEIPSNYYIDRGFKKETLINFDVGDCYQPDSLMYGRSIVPIYNVNGDMVVGYTGRSVWDECELCKKHHNPKNLCPNKEYAKYYTKWRHNSGFPSNFIIYNYFTGFSYAQKANAAILVEGTGHVWKLWEAGFPNSFAVFGTHMGQQQKYVLDKIGVHNLILIPDKGPGGKSFVDNIANLCKNTYNIYAAKTTYKDDIAECSIEKIQEIVRSTYGCKDIGPIW